MSTFQLPLSFSVRIGITAFSMPFSLLSTPISFERIFVTQFCVSLNNEGMCASNSSLLSSALHNTSRTRPTYCPDLRTEVTVPPFFIFFSWSPTYPLFLCSCIIHQIPRSCFHPLLRPDPCVRTYSDGVSAWCIRSGSRPSFTPNATNPSYDFKCTVHEIYDQKLPINLMCKLHYCNH